MEQKNMFSLILLILISFSTPAALYAEDAEEKNWNLRNYQMVRIDTSNELDHTYLTRVEFSLYHEFTDKFDVAFELKPFVEARYLWDREEWSRIESGVEAGFHLGQRAYIGEGFQYASLEGEQDTPELETRLEINIPFVLNSNGYKITLVLIEEYTYATEKGKATRNEIAANFIIPVFRNLEFLCGWRHIDRIHDYDSDQVELSVVFVY